MTIEPMKYTATTESVTVVYEGKPYTVKNGAPQFNNLRKALQDHDWESVPGLLTVKGALSQWSNSKFKLGDDGESVTYEGDEVSREFGRRIVNMATNGEDPSPLFKFYERLQRNPSKRSVDQLWPFLNKMGIPLTKDGCFLAYKGVNSNFTDKHTGKILNKPGSIIKLPRNSISDDPREACHFGLHVGAKRYAQSFGETVVICVIDPEHVVCVPYDSNHEKMRVCEYQVIGVEGSDLPDTVYGGDEGEDSYDTDIDGDANDAEDSNETEEDTEEEKVAVVTKTKVRSKDKGKPSASVELRTKPGKKNFEKYKKWDAGKLMEASLDDLRKYATYGLDIIGASKIAGGKTALVKKILKARG